MLTEHASAMDLVWEVSEIAKIIGRTERQTFYMLKAGQLPAKKVGGRWVAERGQLQRFFTGEAA
ncbi:DNA-binding protein [Rhizobiaceae bacterium n13]|uniref:DNA-binding protein n=1 Tax=Ferirhizobium litorale TaxID=2927786 RepID=UPI0024B2D165|nr:DNA-binding protein [Fererhizobium litorale]MDI7865064.1 DNA-binding protein [Fererhizobium litorale]